MNLTKLEFNELDLIGLWCYYNELDFNWLKLDCVFEVLWDDICRTLALYK